MTTATSLQSNYENDSLDWLSAYTIFWDSPSRNSGESMPCGGHDIGLNVWVEDGDLLFYIDRTGNYDENNQALKSGRGRIAMEPNPFTDGQPFRQELKLREGVVEIKAGDSAVTVKIWCDVFQPVVRSGRYRDQFGGEPPDAAGSDGCRR